jgi:tetraacyldisaccharide-1-P 4'-kinase
MKVSWQWKVRAGEIYRRLAGFHASVRGSGPRKSLPVLVIGSLRSGGGGKTPVVGWIARTFPDCAILVHPTPDERTMLESDFRGRVFSHASFPMGWEMARKAGFSWAISDGGYQDPRLNGGRKILIHDEDLPECPSQLLPFGRWRELAPASSRADLHLVREGLEPFPARNSSGYRWVPHLEGARAPGAVLLACGVGNPARVRCDLEGLGCRIVAEHRVRDHGRFSLRRIARLGAASPGIPWVGTAKDKARWPRKAGPLVVLERDWVPSDPAGLAEWIAACRQDWHGPAKS